MQGNSATLVNDSASVVCFPHRLAWTFSNQTNFYLLFWQKPVEDCYGQYLGVCTISKGKVLMLPNIFCSMSLKAYLTSVFSHIIMHVKATSSLSNIFKSMLPYFEWSVLVDVHKP